MSKNAYGVAIAPLSPIIWFENMKILTKQLNGEQSWVK